MRISARRKLKGKKVDEFETYTRKTYRATLGTTDIELIAVICKPGYCFK